MELTSPLSPSSFSLQQGEQAQALVALLFHCIHGALVQPASYESSPESQAYLERVTLPAWLLPGSFS